MKDSLPGLRKHIKPLSLLSHGVVWQDYVQEVQEVLATIKEYTCPLQIVAILQRKPSSQQNKNPD